MGAPSVVRSPHSMAGSPDLDVMGTQRSVILLTVKAVFMEEVTGLPG